MENFPLFGELPDDEEEKLKEDKKEKKEKSKDKPLNLVNLFEKSFEDKKEAKEDEEPNKEKPEAKPFFEELNSEEQKYATNEIINDRVIELGQELGQVEPETPKEAEVLADVIFMEKVLDKADQAEEVGDELLDDAMAETMKELGIEDKIIELPDREPPEDSPDNEDDAEIIQFPTKRPAKSASPLTPPVTPAHSPVSTTQPTPMPGGGPPGGPSAGPPTNPNTLANLNAAPDLATPESTLRNRPNAAGYFLLGGIVGYIIGKRRTKNKLTKKFEPVKEKLENDVAKLQQGIMEREAKIRRLVSDQQEKQPDLTNKIKAKMEAMDESHLKAQFEARANLARVEAEPDTKNKKELSEEQLVETIDKMDDKDLAEIANLLPKESVDLSKMYESGEISSERLKTVVKEFLKSGDQDRLSYQNMQPKNDLGSGAYAQANHPANEPIRLTSHEPGSINRLKQAIINKSNSSLISIIQNADPRIKLAAVILVSLSFIIIFLWLIGSI